MASCLLETLGQAWFQVLNVLSDKKYVESVLFCFEYSSYIVNQVLACSGGFYKSHIPVMSIKFCPHLLPIPSLDIIFR